MPNDTNTTLANDPPDLLTLALIRAHYVPLAARTLFRMISTGDFPRADIAIGRKVRLWRRETVANWIQSHAEGGVR